MNFTKMQATGNDFIMVDARNISYDWNNMAKTICHRHFGIGADGLITIDKKDSYLNMRIFNADGSEAEVCGNGLRCFAKYVIDRRIASCSTLSIKTNSNIKNIKAFKRRGKVIKVTVNMGTPLFSSNNITLTCNNNSKRVDNIDIMCLTERTLKIDGRIIKLALISMGNPHAISFIQQPVAEYPLQEIGPIIENHETFPEKINFEVASVKDRQTIEARVWERGVGETLACGSGACAIAVAAIMKGLTKTDVDVLMPGGTLNIRWDGIGDVFLTGPVEDVFEGKWIKHIMQ